MIDVTPGKFVKFQESKEAFGDPWSGSGIVVTDSESGVALSTGRQYGFNIRVIQLFDQNGNDVKELIGKDYYTVLFNEVTEISDAQG